MTPEQVAELLKSRLNLNDVIVKGEGSHYQIVAIDECFETMSRVKKQQYVYNPLQELIADGTMHAISIKTFTPEQWQREKLFNQ